VPVYKPFDLGMDESYLDLDLLTVSWAPWGACLEFCSVSAKTVLSIAFEGMVVVRLLDEYHISTEDDPTQRHGIIGNQFSYTVVGHPLMQLQSSALREDGAHYLFLTFNGCADVFSETPPIIAVRPMTEPELQKRIEENS
jgi:hypothetical protein